MNDPHFYTLREISQLRDVHSFSGKGRPAWVRLFFFRGKWGAFDMTGCLWPLALPSRAGGMPSDFLTLGLDRVAFAPDDASGFLQADFLDVVQPSFSSGRMQVLVERWLSRELPHEAPDVTFWFPSSPVSQFSAHEDFQRAKRLTDAWFRSRGYLAFDAPTLVESGGVEEHLTPMRTSWEENGRAVVFELPTSPEFALKKALAMGHPRVFSLARAFRNGNELGRWHRPEFTMLEWYAARQDLSGLIHETFFFLRDLALNFSANLSLGCEPLVVTVAELYEQHFGFAIAEVEGDPRAFFNALSRSEHQLSIQESDEWTLLFWKSFMDVIEPQLRSIPLIFVRDFPSCFSSLARVCPKTGVALRFEAFLHGVEVCNGYDELIDVKELGQRWDAVLKQRKDLARDHHFLEAMGFGLGPCAGNALGLDRVVSLLRGNNALAVDSGLSPWVAMGLETV